LTPLTWHSLLHTVEGLVALGTLALAGGTLVVASVTGWTAHRTRQLAVATMKVATSTEREVKAVVDQAEAAAQQVEVSREALLATYRPRLVNVRLGWTEPNARGARSLDGSTTIRVAPTPNRRGERSVIVPVRNVGTGLALIQQIRLRWHESGSSVLPDETTRGGVPVPAVLPPTERASLNFDFGPGESARVDSIIDLKMFAVEVDYLDVSGQLAEMTRLDVVGVGGDGQHAIDWRVRQVHFYKAGASEPYASSGVAAERD
jgi:hypothetical protein